MRNKYFEQFTPYLIVGFAIAIAVGFMFIMFHVLIWGVVIAGILWAATTVKNYFENHHGSNTQVKKHKHKGVVIEHDNS